MTAPYQNGGSASGVVELQPGWGGSVSRMVAAANRYAGVNELWAAVAPTPPITRAEADAAQRLLYRRFGRKAGHDLQRANVRPERAVPRCWICLRPGGGLDRGWARLVHDVSHRIFQHRFPGWRPHHPQHAALELEIARYVVEQTDWLRGGLRPRPDDPGEVRARKLERVDASLERWDTKLRRAQNAIAKLRRRRAALARLAARGQS